MSWRDLGRCRDLDQSLFFAPLDDEPSAQREAREAAAKAVCQACPVRRECLQWAVSAGERHGVWGGATERERQSMRLRRVPGGRPHLTMTRP